MRIMRGAGMNRLNDTTCLLYTSLSNQVGFNQRKNVLKVEYDYLIHFEHILCIWVDVYKRQVQTCMLVTYRATRY